MAGEAGLVVAAAVVVTVAVEAAGTGMEKTAELEIAETVATAWM